MIKFFESLNPTFFFWTGLLVLLFAYSGGIFGAIVAIWMITFYKAFIDVTTTVILA